MAARNHPWFKPTYYPHFDWTIGEAVAEALVRTPAAVCRHSFLPFISFTQKERRYKPKEHKTIEKDRPLSLASHKDSAIYRYYNFVLGLAYSEKIAGLEMNNCVIGYRKLGGRCNIHFANEVFSEIRKHARCVAVKVDVAGFFPSISHARIKEHWSVVLGKERIPDDHYKVFRSVTCSAEVDRLQLLRQLGIHVEDARSWKGPLCTPADFRSKIRGSGLITVNSTARGIPQGSPLSATLSNIAMLTFDTKMEAWARRSQRSPQQHHARQHQNQE